MGKVANGRLGLVAALAASALGVAPAACDDSPQQDAGGVFLTVTVPADAKVQELTYQVGGNGIEPLSGHWRTSKPEQKFEKLVTHIPAGKDYQLAVSARSIDGRFTCKRETKVSVRSGTISRVTLALLCLDGGDGSIVITVGLGCTTVRLATVTVSPLAASVGGTMALTATALDASLGELVYGWRATSGSFADPTAAQTTYRCDAAGHVTLGLVVAADICQESHQTEVDCLDPSGAN